MRLLPGTWHSSTFRVNTRSLFTAVAAIAALGILQLALSAPDSAGAAGSNAPAAQVETTGSITGRLTEELTGIPIVGAQVAANHVSCCTAGFATTDQNGNYQITGLFDGDHWIRTDADELGFIDEYYDDTLVWDNRTLVSVTAGQTTGGIDFDLVLGGSISGTVFEPGGIIPIADIWVNAFSELNNAWLSGVTTDSSGNYVLGGVPEGPHRVEFRDHSGSFASEFYDNKIQWGSANLISITGTEEVTGINAVLELTGSISGTVLAPDGVTPVEGLGIEARDPTTNDWIAGANTDAAGNYTVIGLRTGNYKIRARASGHGFPDQYFAGVSDFELADVVTVTAPGDTPNIDLTMSPGGTIAGRITDEASGNPISGVRVSANLEQCCGGNGATTDQDGNYEITGLAAGDYRVRTETREPGFIDEYYDNSIGFSGRTPVSVTVGVTTPGIDFALVQGGSISGTVFEPGGTVPIANIWVNAYSETHSEWVSNASTDSSGNYILRGVPEGQHRVEFADHSGSFAGEFFNDRQGFFNADLVQVTGTQSVTGIDAVMDLAGSISGTVLAPDGVTPVQDLTVVALDPINRNWIDSARTDAAGNYSISGLRSGDYKVWARDFDHGFVEQYFDGVTRFDLADNVTVTAPVDTAGIDFTMSPGGTITGRLIDEATGNPISGVWVSADPEQCCGGNSATTDQDGNYQIAGLAPGDYWVRTAAHELGFVDEYYDNSIAWDDRTPVSVTGGVTTPGIDFALAQGGSISGTVFEPGGLVPVAGIWVSAISETHSVWVSDATTDSSGNYVLRGVPAGQHRIEFADQSGSFAREFYEDRTDFTAADLITVTGTQAVTSIDAILDPAGSISGTVLAPDGVTPVSDVWVIALDAITGNWAEDARADSSGNYTIRGLRSGNYKVEAQSSAHGFPNQFFNGVSDFGLADAVTVTAPGDTPNINFLMSPGGTITGRITDEATGNPISGVGISAIPEQCCGGNGATSDQDGNYEITGLVAGDYEVRSRAFSFGFVDEYYDNSIGFSGHTPVSVTVGVTTPGIDFALTSGGSISGTVFKPGGTVPVFDIFVQAFSETHSTWLTSAARTDSSGNYVLSGIPEGQSKVQFRDFSGRFASEFYNDKSNRSSADLIQVTGTQAVTGIDAILDEAGSISGTVFAPDGLTPVVGAWVTAFDSVTGAHVNGDQTDASGNYAVQGLRTGTYKIWAQGFGHGFQDQYFDAVPSFDQAAAVAVFAPGDTPGIDFVMTPRTAVERSSLVHQVLPGDEVEITLTPSGIGDFYAVRENLGGLELVSHTADAFEEGVFVSLAPSPISYVIRVPLNVSGGDQFVIWGQFWEDPGDESAVSPSQTVLTVVVPDTELVRTLSTSTGVAGDIIDVTLTPSGIRQFYAAQENLDGLELDSHDADRLEEGVFVRISNDPIHYRVRIPNTASQGQVFDISGTFWEDPGRVERVTPFVSQVAVVNPNASVNRSLGATGAPAGETVTVTVTPTGINQFYAVREELNGLELVSHTADSFVEGAFVQLGPSPFQYTVRVPDGTPAGAVFWISGVFWEDPGQERPVDPSNSSIDVTGGPNSRVHRELSAAEARPGGTLTVTVTPTGVQQFYAVQEHLVGLELVSHTADEFFDGAFVQLTPEPFQYTVRVPFDASPGDGRGGRITGIFWEDPGQTRIVEPRLSVVNYLEGPASSVERTLSATNVPAGGTVTVTLTPTNVDLFYAVREHLVDLELISHTADGFDDGAFVMLTPDPFEYTVRVPFGTPTGAELLISGRFWEDPGQERPVDPAVSTIRVSQGPRASVERTLSATNVPQGGTVTVTLTPTNVDLFYAVREHLGGLELLSHTADGFDNGVFIMLTARTFDYTVRVPAETPVGTELPISGRFWENPGFEFVVDPSESVVTVGRPASLERTPGSRSATPGEEITFTLTPDGVDLFYAARENLDGLELLSHDADNFEDGVFIRLSPTPINYTVRVPANAPDGAMFNIIGTFWEDPGFELDASPAVTQVRVAVNPAVVERTVDRESVVAGEFMIVTITPTDVDQFYAVQESLGDLEFVSHTADGLDDGAFLMLTPDAFEYTVRVPINAVDGDQFPISGTFWEDPGFDRPVTPPTTLLFVGPAIGLLFVPDELPLDLNSTGTVELHVDDLLGEEVDTVQLKITHDPAVIEISNPSCIGLFADGTPSGVIRDEAAGASWFNCHVTDAISGGSGAVLSFDVTRVGPGNPVLEMVTTGVTRTKFVKGGLVIGTPVRPLNTLQILPDTTVSGTVTIQGVAPGNEQAFAVIGPHVSLVPTSGGRAASVDVNTDGTFAIHGVLDGIYDVILDAPGSLGRRLVGLTVAGVDIDLQPVQLRGGISNPEDDVVEGQDISAVAGSFGLGPSELDGRFAPGTELIVDFNGDLWVSAFDISIVLSNMGETRLQEWNDPAVVTGG